MKVGLLFLNILSIIIGGSSLSYLLAYVDVSKESYIYVWWFIGSFVLTVWGLFAIFLYLVRRILSDKTQYNLLLIRSERQSLLLAILSGVHLSLQGFMIWNLFSAIFLTLIVVILESYFLSKENQNVKVN